MSSSLLKEESPFRGYTSWITDFNNIKTWKGFSENKRIRLREHMARRSWYFSESKCGFDRRSYPRKGSLNRRESAISALIDSKAQFRRNSDTCSNREHFDTEYCKRIDRSRAVDSRCCSQGIQRAGVFFRSAACALASPLQKDKLNDFYSWKQTKTSFFSN